ncbi:MAG: hypothetical protein LBD79_07620 [Treponema sp.]|jgi:hypothetical protein|nr:hypothetical protein [Treponema sp.]
MWNIFKPDEGRWYQWKLCGAEAYLRKTGIEWQSSFKVLPFYKLEGICGLFNGEAPSSELAVSSAWGVGERISLRPYLPMPYFVTLRKPVRLLTGHEARFTVDLPPLFKIECCPDIALTEFMPYTLSKTWFGENTSEGSLYLSLPNALRPWATEDDERPASLARCAITVRNTAKNAFDLRYLAIYPRPLSIYAHYGSLLTDELEFEYTGSDFKMNVKQPGGKPSLLTAGVKTDPGDELLRRSMDIIHHITRI